MAAEEIHDLFGQPAPGAATRVRQLPLPLAWPGHRAADAPAFLMGESNADAVRHVQRFAEWTSPASVLVGPRGSGRSSLGALFLAAGGGAVIDPPRGADEAQLFHQWNRAQAAGQHLLIIADDADDLTAIQLADLKTRLATAPILQIGAPDVCLTRDLVDHLLTARGLHPAPQVASYVAARIERSYAAIHAAVAAIDAHGLATGSQPGVRAVRTALLESGLLDAQADDSGADDSDQAEDV